MERKRMTELQKDNAKRWRKHHTRLTSTGRKPATTEHEWEQRAISYALWIAARDGLTVPETRKVRAEWSGVNVALDGAFKWQRRICAVSWGHETEAYNRRKDGRRGAYIGKEWQSELRIELPHWDWQPEVIEETAAPYLRLVS